MSEWMKSSLIQQTLLTHRVIKHLVQGNTVNSRAGIWTQAVWLMAWAADWYKHTIIEVSKGNPGVQRTRSQPRPWRFMRFFQGSSGVITCFYGLWSQQEKVAMESRTFHSSQCKVLGSGSLLWDPLGLVFTPFPSGDGPRDRARGTKLLYLQNIPRG